LKDSVAVGAPLGGEVDDWKHQSAMITAKGSEAVVVASLMVLAMPTSENAYAGHGLDLCALSQPSQRFKRQRRYKRQA